MEWIRISDKLPENRPCVLIFNPSHNNSNFVSHPVDVSNLDYIRCGNAEKDGYTHWCEIPEYPVAEGGYIKEQDWMPPWPDPFTSYPRPANARIYAGMSYSGISLEEAKLSVGPGWHKLLDEVYANLHSGVIISDVKEKYGALRICADVWDDLFETLLWDIEKRSMTICESCGENGELRTDLSWIKTLCDKCYDERKRIQGIYVE